MPTTINPQHALTELLAELDTAVSAGDRARAVQLEQTILQRLATETAERDAILRRVRTLMEELKLAEVARPAIRPTVRGVESFDIERGFESGRSEAGGVVYPVWFGTNRKPTVNGGGFTSERHDRVTHGRVEVFVPEAHRFGETGAPAQRVCVGRTLS